MTEKIVVDKLGKILVEGDRVVLIAPRYRALVIGTITSFTPCFCNIEYYNTWNYSAPGIKLTIKQTPDQIVKIFVDN